RTWILPPGKADLTGLDEGVRALEDSGFQLVQLGQLRDKPKELHEMFAAAAKDIPSDDPVDDVRYEEWLAEIFHDPLLDDEASFVWLNNPRPVSFTFVVVDRESKKGSHELTGTVPEFRKRGLAKLAKLATARWASDNGVSLLTGNDSTNTGMLGINATLGYEPTPVTIEYVKGLSSQDAK
ncbi:MAG TPA: hypothetical protein VND22_07940, partial [Actinomycetota bacterium]|nr:hypothetical protein [Actinomycetota bacterium]